MEPVGADLVPDGLDEEGSVNREVRIILSDDGDPLRYIPVQHLIDGVRVPVRPVRKPEGCGWVFINREVEVRPVQRLAGVRDKFRLARPSPLPEGRLGGRVLLFNAGRVVRRDGRPPGLEFRNVCGGRSIIPPSDRKSTRLNSSHIQKSRMPSSA